MKDYKITRINERFAYARSYSPAELCEMAECGISDQLHDLEVKGMFESECREEQLDEWCLERRDLEREHCSECMVKRVIQKLCGANVMVIEMVNAGWDGK